jgi:O-glycosyl hydrolase
MKALQILAWGAVGLIAVAACRAEEPELAAQTRGSQTNWLTACSSDDDCDGLSCLCGVCTLSCVEDDACAPLGSGSCVRVRSGGSADSGAIATCDGQAPDQGLCLPDCDGAPCAADPAPDQVEASSDPCSLDGCGESDDASAHVTIDPSLRYQALIGFGASLNYDEETIVQHPAKAALYDAMFLQSGFDLIRLRNRFEADNSDDLLPASEIVTEATARLGRRPGLLMTSGSPPAALKANTDRYCSQSDAQCTLARGPSGSFDYAAFAEYWRVSLEAYEALGIHPDYVSIQNNADWIPPGTTAVEACRFLPVEGTTSVTTPEGESVVAEFPGYAEALAAVRSAVSALAGDYDFCAPEVGSVVMVSPYSSSLAPAAFDAFAFHLYGTDPRAIDTAQLERLRDLGDAIGKPSIQSEMQANGLDTAILVHHALTSAGSAAYLQQQFVSPSIDPASSALIGVDSETFQTLPAYHALSHFARATDPGWRRIEATSDSTELLASAWLSPDERSLTLVLINPGDSATDAEVLVPEAVAPLLGAATVTRTIFDGTERSAALGALPGDHVVQLPARSIVTVAATSE